VLYMSVVTLFFFSSRRRHTRLQGDWSSDVCSSDLSAGSAWERTACFRPPARYDLRSSTKSSGGWSRTNGLLVQSQASLPAATARSEERRVGKECRSRQGR